ncbi:MAG: hypothetical protein NVS2B17_16730 [Candidatus Velthaea sp.]
MAAALVLPLAWIAPAAAQYSAETGIVQIGVVNAATKLPVLDARVTLIGPTTASALTTKIGVVKYTDVPSGLYRIRVVKSGFTGSTSAQFEVLGNKEVDVDVNLGSQAASTQSASTSDANDPNAPKLIGRVSARITVNTKDVDDTSGIRRISDSLTEALGTIAGVDVTQDSNDPDAPQTVSLRGKDESQTAVTLDGIPLAAPGAATNLRSINTDLFSGAGVNFGPQAGALGGSVNFRTLQPTLTWQSRFATSYGTYDRFNYQLGETGSLGKLGFALLHTTREGNNPLTFGTYRDSSGLSYPHGGENSNVGNFAKLRYSLGDRTTLNLTALQSNQGSSALCTQDVTLLPCGIGPGNTNAGRFQFMYASVQSLVGETTTTFTGYVNSKTNDTNDALRYVNGALSPLVTTTQSINRGLAFASTITQQKHTVTLSGSTFAGTTSFVPTVNSSRFVVGSSVSNASQSYQLADSLKVNDKLTLGANASIASTSGAGSSFIGGLNAAWRPTTADAYATSFSVGSSQPGAGVPRTLSDPASARFNCAAQTANVSGPGDLPGKQAAINYDATWTHQGRRGQFSIDMYRQTQTGQLVNAQIAATSLGFAASDPYIAAITGYYQGAYACGAGAVLPVSNVLVSEPVGGTTRVYQGFNLSGRIGFGPNITVFPSYASTSAVITAADSRLSGLNSTTIVGGQIPGRPVHSGNLTIDGLLPHLGLELLANARYVGSNNSQHIAPYVLANLGVSHAVGIGRMTFFVSNAFNTESGVLSSLAFAQPIATSGGNQLYIAANPNQPRSFNISYSFNTGAQRGAGFARAAAGSAASPAAGGQRARGLGTFAPFPPPAGVDPLSVATARPDCKPEDAAAAAPVLAQIKAASEAFAAGNPLPKVDGLALTPHGDPKSGTWYFEIRPESLGGSPAAAGPAPRRVLNVGEGGAAQRVIVGPGEGPRPNPQRSLSPEQRIAFTRFRSTFGCAYFSALTQPVAKAKGFTSFTGRIGLGYAPDIGLFAVRPPELQSGGGSVK